MLGSAGVAGASGRPASGQPASPPREVGEAGSEEECDLDWNKKREIELNDKHRPRELQLLGCLVINR